jgi:hypothetical protein
MTLMRQAHDLYSHAEFQEKTGLRWSAVVMVNTGIKLTKTRKKRQEIAG